MQFVRMFSAKPRSYSFLVLSLLVVVELLGGCSEAQPTRTPLVQSTPAAAPAEEVAERYTEQATVTTAVPTQRQTETPTFEPTETPMPTPTGTPTAEPNATVKPTREPAVIAFPNGPSSLGDTLVRTRDGTIMTFVPGGTFEMGSLPDTDQFGPHAVTLDDFWIDQTEVTNAQYAEFMNDQGNQMEGGYQWLEVEQMENAQIEEMGGTFHPEAGKAGYPVIEVSWYGAAAYCEWVGARLPTEAEWEYAARGPEGYVYPWGNDQPTCEQSQFGGCGDHTVPVGSLSDDGASWTGAKDMAGNVWEWVFDFSGVYPSEPQLNPTGPESGERKVSRGGSFMSAADTLHTAYRHTSLPSSRAPNLGFRCAASAVGG